MVMLEFQLLTVEVYQILQMVKCHYLALSLAQWQLIAAMMVSHWKERQPGDVEHLDDGWGLHPLVNVRTRT